MDFTIIHIKMTVLHVITLAKIAWVELIIVQNVILEVNYNITFILVQKIHGVVSPVQMKNNVQQDISQTKHIQNVPNVIILVQIVLALVVIAKAVIMMHTLYILNRRDIDIELVLWVIALIMNLIMVEFAVNVMIIVNPVFKTQVIVPIATISKNWLGKVASINALTKFKYLVQMELFL